MRIILFLQVVQAVNTVRGIPRDQCNNFLKVNEEFAECKNMAFNEARLDRDYFRGGFNKTDLLNKLGTYCSFFHSTSEACLSYGDCQNELKLRRLAKRLGGVCDESPTGGKVAGWIRYHALRGMSYFDHRCLDVPLDDIGGGPSLNYPDENTTVDDGIAMQSRNTEVMYAIVKEVFRRNAVCEPWLDALVVDILMQLVVLADIGTILPDSVKLDVAVTRMAAGN